MCVLASLSNARRLLSNFLSKEGSGQMFVYPFSSRYVHPSKSSRLWMSTRIFDQLLKKLPFYFVAPPSGQTEQFHNSLSLFTLFPLPSPMKKKSQHLRHEDKVPCLKRENNSYNTSCPFLLIYCTCYYRQRGRTPPSLFSLSTPVST